MLMAQPTYIERCRDFRGNVSARLIDVPHRNVNQRLNFYQLQDGVVNVNRKNLFLRNIPRLNRWKVFDNWTCIFLPLFRYCRVSALSRFSQQIRLH